MSNINKIDCQDWSKFPGDLPPKSRKQRSVDELIKRGICPYEDDKGENVNSIFRSVPSETELDRRLQAAKSYEIQTCFLILGVAGFLVASFKVVTFFEVISGI